MSFEMYWIGHNHGRPGEGTNPEEIDDMAQVPSETADTHEQNMRALDEARHPWNDEAKALAKIAEQMAPFDEPTRLRIAAWVTDWARNPLR